MSIQNISNLQNSQLMMNSLREKQTEETSTSFASVLSDALNSVNDKHINSDNMITDFISGESNISIHEVMLAQQEASLSMQLLIEVRNKAVDMYNELNRVQM